MTRDDPKFYDDVANLFGVHDPERLWSILEQAAQLRKERLEQNRIEDIVHYLVPEIRTWTNCPDGTREEQAARRHPSIPTWWWNRGYYKDHEYQDDHVEVQIESYVGGGETDKCDINFPNEWLSATNWQEQVTEAIRVAHVKAQQAKVEADHKQKEQQRVKDIAEFNRLQAKLGIES